jgi:hypothetical protein
MSRTFFSVTAAFLMLAGSGLAMAEDTALLPLESRSIPGFQPIPITSQQFLASPRLVARGDQTILVWVQQDEEGRESLRSLKLADQRQQDYPIARLIAQPAGEGEQFSPVVALDTAGRKEAWAWLSYDGMEQLLSVKSGTDSPFVLARTEGVIDFPAIEFDEAGVLYAAWSIQNGGRSEAWAAWKPTESEWQGRRLSSGLRPYELLPHLFRNSTTADVYWYSIDGSEIALHGARLSPELSEVLTHQVEGFIPAYRLPILFRPLPDRAPGALWIEPLDDGEVYFAMDPRSPVYPAPTIVGELGAPPALAAVSNDASAAKAWVLRQPPLTTLVAENPHGQPIMQLVDGSVVEPQIAVSQAWTSLAWMERDPATGLATLWFMRTR